MPSRHTIRATIRATYPVTVLNAALTRELSRAIGAELIDVCWKARPSFSPLSGYDVAFDGVVSWERPRRREGEATEHGTHATTFRVQAEDIVAGTAARQYVTIFHGHYGLTSERACEDLADRRHKLND